MRSSVVVVLALATVSACSGGSDRSDAGEQDLKPTDTVEEISADLAGDLLPADVPTDVRVPVPPKIVLDDGQGNRVEIVPEPLAITGYVGEKPVWEGTDTPILLGCVEKASSDVRYDPEFIDEDLRWVPLAAPVAFMPGRDASSASLLFEPEPGRSVRLDATITATGVFSFDVVPEEPAGEVMVQLQLASPDPAENFYGLGESFDKVARRGTVRHMHITLDLTQESGYNEAHFPIPLLVSTRGSGTFVEDRHPGLFDVCKTDSELVSIRFSNGSLRFHILLADTPLQILGRYSDVTGRPALPPQWAFGVVQWRNEVSGQAMVMDDATSMRENDLPCSGIWVDRPFATAHESFIFDPGKYPDSKQMVKDLNALGYRVAIWSAPYLSKDVGDAYAEAEANGYFVESPDINFDKFGKLVDFTDPGLVKLWQKLLKNATDIGIEGFKLDYGEDVISGYMGVKTKFHFFNGEGSETMHHWYHYFYHKTYRDVIEGDAFLLNRAGCYGDQTVTSVCWPGDLDVGFYYHGEDGHVGGLPAAIIGNQTLSASGYPFFGSDTGGYRHVRPTKEILLRWVEHTALSPVLQFGGAPVNCNPWDFTAYPFDEDVPEGYVSQFDPETVEIWRKFARLHIRLFPYVYTYAVAASLTGIPLTRPFGLVHPEMNQHPDFQYFYGDDFTVAPVYRAGNEVTVIVPPGTWIDWFTGELYEGPETLSVDVPLDRLVLLVRQGAMVPMLRETVDTLAPATDADVDSFHEDAGTLVVRTYPAGQGGVFSTVLGPSGKMQHFADEDYFELSFELEAPFTGIRFEIDTLHLAGGAAASVKVKGPLGNAYVEAPSPEAVTSGQCAGCWFFDSEEGRLHVAPGATDDRFTFHPGY